MQLVLFDVDGTLVDGQRVIHECMRRTFEAFGHPDPSLEAVRAMIGLSLDNGIRLLLEDPEFDVAPITSRYKQNWLEIQKEGEFTQPFFPGMRDLLTVLSMRDEVVLGMVTGKSRRGVAGLIAAHGLEKTFLTSRTADDCPSKPHPAMVLECCAETGIDPAVTTVVGDTGFDMEMARSAGARAVGVGWGYHPREQLISTGAAAIAESADDILVFLEANQEGMTHHA